MTHRDSSIYILWCSQLSVAVAVLADRWAGADRGVADATLSTRVSLAHTGMTTITTNTTMKFGLTQRGH